jgi:hypothetical protein
MPILGTLTTCRPNVKDRTVRRVVASHPKRRATNRSTLMALAWGNPATVRNFGDGAVSTLGDARLMRH